jgi:uncharacterized membrane protein
MQKRQRLVTTQDFITELFCRVDDQMEQLPKHSQAALYQSEIVTLAFILPSKELMIVLFIVGSNAISGICSPVCRSERACSACSRRIVPGLKLSWLSRPSWV